MVCQLMFFISFQLIIITTEGRRSSSRRERERNPVRLGVNVQEENLMNVLFGRESQYNALITPIHNSSEPLDVYFGLTLVQIINVYEKEQIVKVNVWLQLRWYDYQMKWNPDRYGQSHSGSPTYASTGILGRLESIRVPPDRVWTPDLMLFN
jgi:hypothetical protein